MSKDPLSEARRGFDRASARFDALYTAITNVQRELLGLRRDLDECDASVPVSDRTGLAGKLEEISLALEDLHRFSTPARSAVQTVGRAAFLDPPTRIRNAIDSSSLTDAVVRAAVVNSEKREAFLAVGLVAEYMEDGPDVGMGLKRLPIAPLLGLARLVGARTVSKILAAAALPADVRFGDLEPGDSARLIDAMEDQVKRY